MQRRPSVFELKLHKLGVYILYSVLVPVSITALTLWYDIYSSTERVHSFDRPIKACFLFCTLPFFSYQLFSTFVCKYNCFFCFVFLFFFLLFSELSFCMAQQCFD